MKVFISNRLDTLSDILYEKLFKNGSFPLEKRWVIVASEEIKLDLYLRWLAQTNVVTGIQTITYGELVRKVFPALPSRMELALRIETALEKDEELALYLKEGLHLRRLDLSHELSSLFLKYLKRPLTSLEDWLKKQGWQQRIWKEVFGETLPTETVRPLEGFLFFYNIEQLAPYEWNLFSQMNSYWFLFSPSEMYLGDFQTERQQRYTLKQAKGAVREELSHYFEQDSPLLSNWGRAGRELFRFFEDVETQELFQLPEEASALHQLQTEWLTLNPTKGTIDSSLQLHSAPNLLREVEVVWEVIEKLPHMPRDILVLAPDIQHYAAAIEWVFKERSGSFDYTITGVEAKMCSLFLQGFETLLSLPKFQFSKETFEKLLLCPPFLKRFDLSLEDAQTLCEWMKDAHLRYGLTGNSGSWEATIKRAMETVVISEENPSLSLGFTEIPLLNCWIEITLKIQQLMTPALDLKKRSGPEWADWVEELIEAFFVSEEETDLINSVLATLRNERVGGVFSYLTVERLLLSALTNQTGSIHHSTPQVIRFASIKPGAITSAKTIILMGMQEGSFPRPDTSSSLPAFAILSRTEEDRYLFLEAISHAKEELIMTYSRLHPEDGKEVHPCSLIEELKKDREGLMTFHHPVSALDPIYYQSSVIQSASSIHYNLLKSRPKERKAEISLSVPARKIIDLRLLKKLARHPVQCFFEESLGLRFPWKETEAEFLFSPLEMQKLRASSLSVDHLINKLDSQGKLPMGSFRGAAIQTIEKELTHYQSSLDELGIDRASFFTLELSAHCTSPIQISKNHSVVPPLKIELPSGEIIEIQGTIDGLSEGGLLFHGDGSLEDLLKIWPIYCTAQTLLGERCSSLFLTKKSVSQEIKIENPQEALGRYLGYLQKSLQAPSPLLPAWGRRILKGGDLQASNDDEILVWAETRNLLPPLDEWVHEWRPYLQEVLRELL